jgi:hypothetical protein
MSYKYIILQLSIGEDVYADVNKLGHDGASEKHPVWNAKLKVTMSGSEGFSPEDLAHYRSVARVDAESLDHVFTIGNVGPESAIERLEGKRMHSLSVGDIVVDEAGNHHMVDNFGFTQVKKGPSHSNLKMNAGHFHEVRELVEEVLRNNPDAVVRYESGDFARSDRTKELQKRFCFDVHYVAMNKARDGLRQELYEYLDDDHIYTALKRMCPAVEMKFDPKEVADRKVEADSPSP